MIVRLPTLTKNAQRPVFLKLFSNRSLERRQLITLLAPVPCEIGVKHGAKSRLYFTLRAFAGPSNIIAA
jgi:hypothetical protein